jgi:hypothetical protein
MAERDFAQPGPKHVDHPFSFAAEDLILNGSLVEPQDGDTMEIVSGGTTKVYRLAAPFDGGRDWRYADGYETGEQARIYWNGRLKSVT